MSKYKTLAISMRDIDSSENVFKTYDMIERAALDDCQKKLDEAVGLLKSIYNTGKYVPVKHQKKIDEFLRKVGG